MPDFVNAQSVAVVAFLALVNNRVIEYFIKPLFLHFNTDLKWLMYVSAITGLVLGMLTVSDLFAVGMFTHPLVSRIITALIIAGGSNLIHDLMDKKEP